MVNTQEQKKDKKGLIVLVLLLVAVVSTTFAVTFSRYMTKGDATSSAIVAHWQIDVGEAGSLQTLTEQGLDLTGCTWTSSSNAETGTIAPGSVGTCVVRIENNSDVDAEISVGLGQIVDHETQQAAGITTMSATLENGASSFDLPHTAGSNYRDVTITVTWDASAAADVDDDETVADTQWGSKEQGTAQLDIPITITAAQKITP